MQILNPSINHSKPEYIIRALSNTGYQNALMPFPQFSRLPKELQLKIWGFMLPPPRVVDVVASHIYDRLEEKLTTSSCTTDPKSTSWVETHIESVFAKPMTLPSLFHTCRDSRELMLQHYMPLECELRGQRETELESLPPEVRDDGLEVVFRRTVFKGDRPFTLLDPRRDILYVDNPGRNPYSLPDRPEEPSMSILLRWLSSDIKENVRRIVMKVSMWREAIGTKTWELLVQFKRLEELYVTLHTEVFPVLGIEEQVRRDLNDLSRDYPQWKTPVARLVRRKDSRADSVTDMRRFELRD